MPAFLAFEQRSVWIAQVQSSSIIRQCPAQALAHIHSARLAAFALFSAERELCACVAFVVKNIPAFQCGDFLGTQPRVEAEQDDGLITSWMTTTAAVV